MKSSFLIRSIQSEWLKAKRSSSSWFVWVGALFVPFIITLIQTFYPNRFGVSVLNPFWVRLFERTWEMTAILLLPMGIVIACSLICQIEFRNNTWKQVYATPQHVSTVFFAKYFVVLLMFFKWLIIFTVAFLVSAYLPSLLNGRMIFTDEAIPVKYILENAISFYISALPIIALQYLLSMRFRNFIVPIGV
ncbi:MAG: ABC transporter permease, partial [Flavobacteriales bacterium]